jgi:hypothetical protein
MTLMIAPILGLAALGVMASPQLTQRRSDGRFTPALSLSATTHVMSHATSRSHRSAVRRYGSSTTRGLANRRLLLVSDEFGEARRREAARSAGIRGRLCAGESARRR